MTFIKSLKAFISRWGDVAGPLFIFCASVIFMMISNINRTVQAQGGLYDLLSFPQSLENIFYDYRVKKSVDRPWIDPDIVIVNIDDTSLSKIGSWPIPRKNHTKLIEQLKNFGAKVITLDILFPENSPDLTQDQAFANALAQFKQNGREVILPYTLSELDPEEYKEQSDALSPTPDFVYMQSGNAQLNEPTKPFWINRHTFPIDELMKADPLMGHIGNAEDKDGVFRHYRIIANFVDDTRSSVYVASLGLATAEAYSGEKAKILTTSTGEAILDFKGKTIKLDELGEIKVRYSAGRSNYQHVSFYDVITAPVNDAKMKRLFEGKIVMVGSTAEGAHDLRNSPIDSKMPGMYAHTNVMHQLLHGYVYLPTEKSFNASALIMFIAFLIMVVVQRWGNAMLDLVTLVSLIAVIVLVDSRFFLPNGYELRLAWCMLCVLNTYSWTTFVNFRRAAKEKKQIKGTFARYVSPAIVNEMLENPEKLRIGGERRDITCLFSDVRDFTSISEKLSATELSGMLNQYMNEMTKIVFETKGTLDKYIGDAVVAIWGAPVDVPDHPELAVGAAVKMMELMPAINEDFQKRGLPYFKVGIGLNSGECSVGNMGSDLIFSYTALGDNMNLGARLEGLCKYYGAHIIISEFTFDRLSPGKFKTRVLDKVKVKGKELPVKIIEVIHGAHPLMQNTGLLDSYNEAYQSFMEQNFSLAKELLGSILLRLPEDKPSIRLLKLCEKWLNEPAPADFDVTTMTEK